MYPGAYGPMGNDSPTFITISFLMPAFVLPTAAMGEQEIRGLKAHLRIINYAILYYYHFRHLDQLNDLTPVIVAPDHYFLHHYHYKILNHLDEIRLSTTKKSRLLFNVKKV